MKKASNKATRGILILLLAPVAIFVGFALLKIIGEAIFRIIALCLLVAIPLAIGYGIYRLVRCACRRPEAEVVGGKKDTSGHYSRVDFARIDRRLKNLDTLLSEKDRGKGGPA